MDGEHQGEVFVPKSGLVVLRWSNELLGKSSWVTDTDRIVTHLYSSLIYHGLQYVPRSLWIEYVSMTDMANMIIYGYIVFARLDICVQWCAHICCVVVRMCAHWNMYLLVQTTSGDKQVRRERKGGRERGRERERKI